MFLVTADRLGEIFAHPSIQNSFNAGMLAQLRIFVFSHYRFVGLCFKPKWKMFSNDFSQSASFKLN